MYRLSDYNCYVRYNDQVIYFNTLKRRPFIMSPEEHYRLQTKWEDPITFSLEFPSLFEQFKKWGFFVEEGLSELDCIREVYHRKVNDFSLAHLFINLSSSIDNMGETGVNGLINRLTLHLLGLVSGKQAPERFILEWKVDTIFQLKRIVKKVNHRILNECTNYNIEFNSQVIVTRLSLVRNKFLFEKELSISAILFNVILSKEKESFIQNISAANLLTFLTQINSTTINTHITLHISVNQQVTQKQISEIENKLKQLTTDYLSVNFLNMQEYDWPKAGMLNYALPIRDELFLWQPMNIFSKSNYTLLPNGNVYFGKYTAKDECRCIGTLNQDGTIEHMHRKFSYYYGKEWFANEKCSKCKYLPLLFGICSLKAKYYENILQMDYPVESKQLSTDEMIINIHESKE